MQSRELPPKQEIETLIGQHNEQLRALARRGIQPSDAPRGVNVEVNLPPQTDFPAFLNHHLLGNTVALARVDLERASFKGIPPDTELVNGLRDGAIAMIATWVGTGRASSDLERETCEAILEAARSFDWTTNPELLDQLTDIGSELGNDYSMLLNGKRLIGH